MIPTNVITGSLGAGKTTIILNLVKQYPKDYKLLWLKNEYGDTNVDTELLNQSAIKTKEIVNGCLCCVLIGKLEDALVEISKLDIDRLIIETAGTAYPYPIFHAVTENKNLELDSLVKVIDFINFDRIEDKSQMAKEQEKYIDLIIYNKHEEIDAQEFDRIEDEVFEIYPEVEKVKSDKGLVDKSIITGIERASSVSQFEEHHDQEKKNHHHDHIHHHEDIETFFIDIPGSESFEKDKIEEYIAKTKDTDIFRIKGFLQVDNHLNFVNSVNGRTNIQKVESANKTGLLFMGKGISGMQKQTRKEIENLAN